MLYEKIRKNRQMQSFVKNRMKNRAPIDVCTIISYDVVDKCTVLRRAATFRRRMSGTFGRGGERCAAGRRRNSA